MSAQLVILQKNIGSYLGFLGEEGGRDSGYGEQGGMHLDQVAKQSKAESIISGIKVGSVDVMQGCMKPQDAVPGQEEARGDL